MRDSAASHPLLRRVDDLSTSNTVQLFKERSLKSWTVLDIRKSLSMYFYIDYYLVLNWQSPNKVTPRPRSRRRVISTCRQVCQCWWLDFPISIYSSSQWPNNYIWDLSPITCRIFLTVTWLSNRNILQWLIITELWVRMARIM